MEDCYKGFVEGVWSREINVRDFIQKNYTPYDGDDSFLAGPTEATLKLWDQVMELSRQEREAGDYFPRPGLSEQGSGKDRRLSDRQTVQAFPAALRRHPHGAESLLGQRL